MKLKILLTAILGFFILSSAVAAPQELVGTWDLEINADGEYFYLTLVLEETEGELSGKISEETGFFTDVALDEIKLEGKTLTFQFDAPTPPDGEERLLTAEFVFSGEDCEGTLSIEDLGMIVDVTGEKQKQSTCE